MKTVGIIGYGYVGSAMERVFRKAFRTTYYDPIHQPDKEAVQGVDLAIVCVPTPSSPDGTADVSAVYSTFEWLKAKNYLIKSTIPPGTTRDLSSVFVKPIHFSPEYMGEPGIPVSRQYLDPVDFTHHGFVIVGGDDPDSIFPFFQKVMPVDTRFLACEAIEAEMAKYMENAYFAAKVTFCNEFANICKTFGVSYPKVRELWLSDPRIEPDHTAVFPDAPGFGGKCLPKDLDAIFMAADRKGYTATFLASIMAVNDSFRKKRTK